MTLKLIADNEKPDKPPRVRRAPMVSPYCPVCGSSTWISANQGPADILEGPKPRRVRCCAHCLSKGKVTVW
jgi:hypothetical protein